MNNPFRTPEDYELFLYMISENFPSVRHSAITFVRLGTTLARVSGELRFDRGIRLIIRERILYDRLPVIADWYGYEVWQNEEKIYWYDSQPHPDDFLLRSSHPHHKHIPPDMKHNRIPAPEMSFDRPNLPVLIREIEKIMKQTANT